MKEEKKYPCDGDNGTCPFEGMGTCRDICGLGVDESDCNIEESMYFADSYEY